MGALARFPHCDQRILHAPEDGCEYCDQRPEWQELRKAWGIAFTGHPPRAGLPRCRKPMRDTFPGYGPGIRCGPGRPRGRVPPRPRMGRDAVPGRRGTPQDSSGDHRRWAGNKPTTTAGDPEWPAETAASRALYGDKGGRASWPLAERLRRRVRRPVEDRRKRRRGWRKENGWWRSS